MAKNNEISWVVISNKDCVPIYHITSNKDRTLYYLYDLKTGEKVAKNPSPNALEKFIKY